jgi:hypothetical protein
MTERVGHSPRALTLSAAIFAVLGIVSGCLTFVSAPSGYRLVDVVIAVFFLGTALYFALERRAASRLPTADHTEARS